MQLQGGTLLHGGSYRIIETLGRGGFGVTYLAEQVSLHRQVCIKEFFPKDYYKRDDDSVSISLLSESFKENMSRFKAKFIKEAKTIALLDHPNIIHILDVFEENNTCYYAMDYIEGESLSERVKRGGAMSEDVAVSYIKQVASALEHIHEQQIMHLDVKPGNIMVRSKDDRAILIDFGLSKHYDATSGEATSTTPVGVSHGFAPMEQYKQGGVNRFSPETDIYSLGATLYYIATGIVPPHAADMGKDGIGELPSELSSGVCAAIRKSMNYWKEDRPHTIKEFLELLDSKTATPIVPIVVNEKTTLDSNNNIASEQKSAPKPVEQKQEAEQKKPTEQKQTPKATPTEKKATEPKAAPAEKKAAEPKKEWTPKYSTEKPKTSDDEKSKKRWLIWLLGLLLIICGAYFIIGANSGDNSDEKRSNTPREERNDNVQLEESANAELIEEVYAEYEATATVEAAEAMAEIDNSEETRLAEEEATRQAEQQRIAEQKQKEEAARKAEQQRIDNMVAQGLGRDGVYQIGDYYKVNGKEGVVYEVCDGGRQGKIVSLDETRATWNSAIKWCCNKGDDWDLADRDELKAISNNRSKIDFTLAKYGTELSIYGYYWSSTEYGEFTAWSVYMSDGSRISDDKLNGLCVRAVSAF